MVVVVVVILVGDMLGSLVSSDAVGDADMLGARVGDAVLESCTSEKVGGAELGVDVGRGVVVMLGPAVGPAVAQSPPSYKHSGTVLQKGSQIPFPTSETRHAGPHMLTVFHCAANDEDEQGTMDILVPRVTTF